MISVCQHADRSLATVLIHAVALPVLEQLIHHATVDKPRDEAELMIVQEAVRLAELLVSLAEEQSSTSDSAVTRIKPNAFVRLSKNRLPPGSCPSVCLTVPSRLLFNYKIQESPANAKGMRDSSACMKAHCEQM